MLPDRIVVFGASLGLSAWACAPPPAPSASNERIAVTVGDASTAKGGKTSPPLPATLEPPGPVTCRFSAARYEEMLTLHLGAAGPSFAYAAGMMRDVEVTLSDTNTERAGIAFTSSTHTFRVSTSVADLKFFPKKAKVWNGFLVPHANAAVGHTSFIAKKTTVEPKCRGARFLGNPAEDASCDDVSLTPASYDPMSLVPGKKTGRDAGLVLGKPILLSAEPRGKPIAELDPDQFPLTNVTVTDTQGDRSRITWDADQCVIFGWIATKDLLKGGMADAPLRVPRADPLMPLAPKEPIIETLKCTSAVPLVAQHRNERMTIGTVAASWDFHIAEHQADGWSRLMMPEALVWEGTRLFVRTADIEGCEKRPDPR